MKVSIIIPFFNAAAFLQRAIEAALSQEYSDTELILVDNNSTDNSRSIAQNFQQTYPDRVRIITEKQQGCSAARNAGLAIAQGEWIQFLDADDTINPGKIAHQLSLLKPATRWVIAGYRHLYADGTTEDSIPHQDPWQGLVHNFAIGCTHANLYHRDALSAVDGWDANLADNTDTDLHFRLLAARTKYLLDPAINSFYHHHAGPRVSSRKPTMRLVRKVGFHQRVNAWLVQQRPAYWQIHAPHFRAASLRAIRLLATHDLPAAQSAYDRELELGASLDHRIVSGIVKLYPVFGFSRVERVRRWVAPLFPHRLKSWLKSNW